MEEIREKTKEWFIYEKLEILKRDGYIKEVKRRGKTLYETTQKGVDEVKLRFPWLVE